MSIKIVSKKREIDRCTLSEYLQRGARQGKEFHEVLKQVEERYTLERFRSNPEILLNVERNYDILCTYLEAKKNRYSTAC